MPYNHCTAAPSSSLRHRDADGLLLQTKLAKGGIMRWGKVYARKTPRRIWAGKFLHARADERCVAVPQPSLRYP